MNEGLLRHQRRDHSHIFTVLPTLGIWVSSNTPKQTNKNMAAEQPREPC